MEAMLKGNDYRRAAALSLALLIPCFWHETIQAGDLSSHIYNAWLAQQVQSGKAPGLFVAFQSSNVLFDLILSALFNSFGAAAAQRIAVSLCVLILFWGAFALITTINSRPPWLLTPCLAMLSYGWTFHSGIFNFYLGSGLSLWALALFWNGGAMRIAGAAALLAVAYTAHGLPVAWAVAAIAYVVTARFLPERMRIVLLAGALAAVVALRYLLVSRYGTFWSPHQVLEAGAVDQMWVFGLKYIAISLGIGLYWGFVFLKLSHGMPTARLAASIPFHLCALLCVGVLLIPTRIELPGYNAALFFITERMTLISGVTICALLASIRPERWQTGLLAVLTVAYFAFLYVDTGKLDAAERRLGALYERIPPGSRVFASFSAENSRIILWPHAVDRQCVGRCVSYNNYEPYTAAFRIRAQDSSPMVIANAREHNALQDGGYVVKERDLPLYQVQLCGPAEEFCIQSLKAGEVTKAFKVSLLPLLW